MKAAPNAARSPRLRSRTNPNEGVGIERHTPFGYYNFADSYLAAANLIAEQGLRATHPNAPAAFLYYHAIELNFKSVLLLRGTTPEALKSLEHDFRKLRAR